MIKTIIITFLLGTMPAWADFGNKNAKVTELLTINAAEIGIGKFHRHDSTVHNYTDTNVWKTFVMAPNATPDQTYAVNNNDGSVTIFFTSLEELVKKSIEMAESRNAKIAVFNLNAHGMPGGNWFPKDEANRASADCAEWRAAAAADDQVNYDQYYTPVSYQEIMDLRKASEDVGENYECISGLDAWQVVVRKHSQFKKLMADNAQIHFLSCIVGLGPVGENFTTGLAELLLDKPEARIETSLQYGLGDWSIEQGMSFWDYQSDEQLNKDNEIYPVERSDRSIMQLGTIRVGTYDRAHKLASSGLIENADFIYLTNDTREFIKIKKGKMRMNNIIDPVRAVRIPGTLSYSNLK